MQNNVLMSENHEPCIADFGLAMSIYSQASSCGTSSRRGKGAIRWQAPETIDAGLSADVSCGPTTRSDVYAYACVCLEVSTPLLLICHDLAPNLFVQIFTGEVPFANLSDGAVVVQVVVHDKRPPRPSEPTTQRGLNDYWWITMQMCWLRTPANRPEMPVIIDWLHLSGGDACRPKFFSNLAFYDFYQSESLSMHLCSFNYTRC